MNQSIVSFNPPLYRNGVEVTQINNAGKKLNLIVHVVASSQEEVKSYEVQRVASKMIQQAIIYLEMEGFIEEKGKQWLTQVGFVLHPPGSDNFQNA